MSETAKGHAELLPCPFCDKAMRYRAALWPSEGDTDGIQHAEPTDCPMSEFSDHWTHDGSIIEKWNSRSTPIAAHGAGEGWRHVPVEPTKAMLDAGIRARADGWGADRIANAYRAMLAAAPSVEEKLP